MSKEIIELSNQKVKIPIIGDCESLNAACAGAVLMYKSIDYLRIW